MPYIRTNSRKKNDMNILNKTQLIEATAATVAVIGLGAIVIPSLGVMTAVVLVAAGLAGMAALETKKRAY